MNSAEKQLAILLEFGKVINKTKSLDDVLESMANFARDILQADRCSIFIYGATCKFNQAAKPISSKLNFLTF